MSVHVYNNTAKNSWKVSIYYSYFIWNLSAYFWCVVHILFAMFLNHFLAKSIFFFVSKNIAFFLIKHVSAHLFDLFFIDIIIHTFMVFRKWLELETFYSNCITVKASLRNKKKSKWSHLNRIIVNRYWVNTN